MVKIINNTETEFTLSIGGFINPVNGEIILSSEKSKKDYRRDPDNVPYEEDFWFDPPNRNKKFCAYCREECIKKYQVRRFPKTILLNDIVMMPKGRNHKSCWKQFEEDNFTYISPIQKELDKL